MTPSNLNTEKSFKNCKQKEERSEVIFLKEGCAVIVWFTNQKKGAFSLVGLGYKNMAVQAGSRK